MTKAIFHTKKGDSKFIRMYPKDLQWTALNEQRQLEGVFYTPETYHTHTHTHTHWDSVQQQLTSYF